MSRQEDTKRSSGPCFGSFFLRFFKPVRKSHADPHALEPCIPGSMMHLEECFPGPGPPHEEQAGSSKPQSDALLQTSQERLSRFSRRETLLGISMSIWLHITVALGALLLPGAPSGAPPETRFVMVSLTDGGASGAGGTEGAGNGGTAGADQPGGGEITPCTVEEKPQTASSDMPREPEPVSPTAKPKKCALPKSTNTPRSQPTRIANVKPVKAVTEQSTTSEAASPPNPAEESPAAAPSPGTVSDQPGQGCSGQGGPAVPGGGGGKGGSGHSGHGRGIGAQNTFGLDQVDRPPVVLRKVEPEFPAAARKMDLSGRVVAKFLVKPDGHVSNVTILEMHPSGVFEQSVVEALAKWEFKPGIYKDKAVSTWVVLPVRFRVTR